ncbi:hypothetical protein BD408DRAFT_406761 [Parasitella parasitica]|nr:hypothetical protein BD408DRAFT_406761 [Parasitella parasitica]
MAEKKKNYTDSQVTEKARNQTHGEYSSSQSYEKDFDTAPNRDNLLSEFEDDLEDMEVEKDLHEPDDGRTDEYNGTQQYRNPTVVGDLKTNLNEFQNPKDNGTSNSFKMNYTRTERPRVEASSSFSISSPHNMNSKYAHITLESLRAKEMKYELMIQAMRDQVVDRIESDDPDSFQEVSQLNEKIKVMDGILQGVRADLAHKDKPVQRNVAVPTGSNQTQGSISPPVNSDAILPHENLQSIMELLVVHSSSVHWDLLERYQVEVEKQTKSANDRKRGRSDNLAVGPAASNDEAKTPPFKRIDRKGHNTAVPPQTGSLCTHCEKVKFYPGHFCPERIAFQNARQNAAKGIDQPVNMNRTAKTAGVNMVRTARQSNMHPVNEQDLNDCAQNIMKILSQINPLTDDDDMAEFLDESTMNDLDVPSSDNNGKTDDIHIKYNGRDVHHSFFIMKELGNDKHSLFGCDIFSKLGITLAGVAFNWDDNKILYDDAVVDEKYVPNTAPVLTSPSLVIERSGDDFAGLLQQSFAQRTRNQEELVDIFVNLHRDNQQLHCDMEELIRANEQLHRDNEQLHQDN